MKANGTHALIVGIDKYDSPNLSPLEGARNDAIAWYRFCVRHLRIAPENIAVLANPPLTARDLGPEAEQSRLRGGSRADIVEEATLLARAASDGGAGLVTFSGHGLAMAPARAASTEIDLSLCPSDVKVELPDEGDASVTGALRFSELSDIFRSQDSRDNITVLLDTCYSRGPSATKSATGAVPAAPSLAAASSPAQQSQLQIKPKGSVDALGLARKVLKVDAFTNRLILGARHWTEAYEMHVGGQWRGAASFAMLTVMERWALRSEGGVTYPNISHGDLLDRMRDLLAVLGVPQIPALWGQRRLDEMPVLRPGLRFAPGETSARPDAPMNKRQIPVDPDYVGLLQLSLNGNPIVRVVITGESLPSGARGLNKRTEYWYTNTSSPPALSSGLNVSLSSTQDQATIDAFISGYTLSIQCAQLIGKDNWRVWSTGDNPNGALLKTADPTGKDNMMGLYLQYNSNGTLQTYCWYRISLLDDGFAFYVNDPPDFFASVGDTNPNTIETGAWRYSLVLPPP